MHELVRSNDLVYLSWVQAVLTAEGIESVVLDGFTSAVEGSIGAIPRRLVVHEDDAVRAEELLMAASQEDART